MIYQDWQLMSKETHKLIPILRFPEFRKEKEWEERELSKLGTLVNGLTYSPTDVSQDGLLVLRSSNVQNGQIVLNDCVYVNPDIKGANITQPDDILICIRNGSKSLIGKNAIIPKDIPLATHGAFMTVFRAEYPKFVFQLFQTNAYYNQVNADLGATINSINGGNFLKYKFIVPKLKEQQKIASCLSSLDNVIAAHDKKLEALKYHKKGLMQNLFPQEGENVPKYRFKEFKKDGDWANSTLGEICIITSGGTPNRSNSVFWNGNIPWISTALIDFNTIYHASEFITEAGLQNSSAKIFQKGTILMAMYGQGKTRGKVAILGIEATTNQACAAIILKEGYKTNYVFQYLAAHYNEIRELSNKGGQENLSGSLIEIIRISIPKPKEQQKIANFLSSLDDLITAQTEKIEQLKLHKKGLMQGLFPKINE